MLGALVEPLDGVSSLSVCGLWASGHTRRVGSDLWTTLLSGHARHTLKVAHCFMNCLSPLECQLQEGKDFFLFTSVP